jgi:AraC family transcriptional regulator
MRITAVPLHDSDLVRRSNANGFSVTEAWSPHRPIPAHAHQELSLTILLKGTFEETYSPIHKPQECCPGSLLIRPAGEVHANRLGRNGGRTLSIEFDPERLELYGTALKRWLTLDHRREPAFLDIGLAMSQELSSGDVSAALSLESLALELLARIVRWSQRSESRTPPTWLAKAKNQIQDTFRDSAVRIAELAAANGVHPVYFARIFREFYRVTPGGYVRRLRLEAARQLVVRTAEPLSSIALECGFADQSHFVRAFRRKFGLTPGHLRRDAFRSATESSVSL